MSLPYMPIIDECVIIRHKGKLKGKITPGEVFAWNPDSRTGRELVIVHKVENGYVFTWDMGYERIVNNSEDCFRKTVYRTRFKLFPSAITTMMIMAKNQCKPTSTQQPSN